MFTLVESLLHNRPVYIVYIPLGQEIGDVKVSLDDLRATPNGWVHAYWPDEVINYLKTGKVDIVSLDHDLGDDNRGTGYDVILWIEAAVATQDFRPPEIKVHRANSAARARMEAGINAIYALANKR